jgi:hypothetical protein
VCCSSRLKLAEHCSSSAAARLRSWIPTTLLHPRFQCCIIDCIVALVLDALVQDRTESQHIPLARHAAIVGCPLTAAHALAPTEWQARLHLNHVPLSRRLILSTTHASSSTSASLCTALCLYCCPENSISSSHCYLYCCPVLLRAQMLLTRV